MLKLKIIYFDNAIYIICDSWYKNKVIGVFHTNLMYHQNYKRNKIYINLWLVI